MPEVVSARKYEQKRASLRLRTPDFSPSELSTLEEVRVKRSRGTIILHLSAGENPGKTCDEAGGPVGMVAWDGLRGKCSSDRENAEARI